MPRTCTVCAHPERGAIDRALLAGEPFRHVASRFETSTTALQRHKRDHLSGQLAGAAERNAEADVRTAIDVIEQLREINTVARTVLQGALARGDGTLALHAIDRVQKQIELQARLIDLLRDGDTVNVIISPQWIEVRAVILDALTDHPAAAQAVAAALVSLDSGGEP